MMRQGRVTKPACAAEGEASFPPRERRIVIGGHVTRVEARPSSAWRRRPIAICGRVTRIVIGGHVIWIEARMQQMVRFSFRATRGSEQPVALQERWLR